MQEDKSLQNSLNRIKIGLFNVENLFLLFDHPLHSHFEKMPEDQWQKLSGSVYENKPLKKTIALAELIKSENPDVVMLCEVGGAESLKNFNRLFLSEKYSVALIEGNSDRNIDVGFIIKNELNIEFSITSNKNRPLVSPGIQDLSTHALFTRDCAQLQLFDPQYTQRAGGKPFLTLLLTHLKSRLDPERTDPGGVERRSAEVRTLVQIYNELCTKTEENRVVLAGDFNGYAGKEETDTEFLPIYQFTDLEDVLEIAKVNIEKRATFYQIKNSRKPEGKQIDFCFLSSALKKHLNTSTAYVYRYKDDFGFEIDIPKSIESKSALPSDHYPIFFTLENL